MRKLQYKNLFIDANRILTQIGLSQINFIYKFSKIIFESKQGFYRKTAILMYHVDAFIVCQ